MRAIGIDIGTTTICAIVLDAENGRVIESVTVDNDSFIKTENPFEKVQNPEVIIDKAIDIVDKLVIKHAPITCIGISGQMHGIVYVDASGNAVSNLYIWQDGRGDIEYKDGQTYAEFLTEKTGYKMATGFGLTTHFYNMVNGTIPKEAVKFCTIHDYFAMKLVDSTEPIINPTDAASFGFYDLKKNEFDIDACNKVGIDIKYLPKIKNGFAIIGKTKDGIPVSAAIGDNQASFFGSAENMNESLLINVGTGSQISLCSDSVLVCKNIETRPCTENSVLLVGSSLCGGRAFALLEEFFKNVSEMVTGEKVKSAYPGMDKCLANIENLENPLEICTKFSGTRENSNERGSISNIGIDNLTPQHLMLGVLNGMVDELYDMYMSAIQKGVRRPNQLVGSGNGLRKNETLKRVVEKKFGMSLKIPVHKEEASYGAALFALVSTGVFKDMTEAQAIIKYEEKQER